MKATKTNIRRLVQESRNEAASVRNLVDLVGIDKVRASESLREAIAESLNTIDGNSALLREFLVEPITEEW